MQSRGLTNHEVARVDSSQYIAAVALPRRLRLTPWRVENAADPRPEGNPMRHNGRPALRASRLKANQFTLYPGERITIECPDCGTWRPVDRGMVRPHRLTDHGREAERKDKGGRGRDERCPGSAQRFVIDINAAQWMERVQEANREAGGRRSNKVIRKPKVAVAPPVSRLGSIAAAQPKRADLRLVTVERARADAAGHRIGCTVCTGYVRCETGLELEVRLAETEASWTLAREQQGRREKEEFAVEQVLTADRGQQRIAGWRRVGPAMTRTDAEREVERAHADFADHRKDCPACAGTARCEVGRRKDARMGQAEAAWKQIAA